MSKQANHGELAFRIREAYAGTPIEPIRSKLAELDIDAAYAIQHENTAFWQAAGRRLVGSKIGLTSLAVQKQLGVDRPVFGVLFADMLIGEDEPIALGRVLQPKIEAEVAFLIDRDVEVEAPTVADMIRAVGYAMPALEVVDSRISNWDIGIVDTVDVFNLHVFFFLRTTPMNLIVPCGGGLRPFPCRPSLCGGWPSTEPSSYVDWRRGRQLYPCIAVLRDPPATLAHRRV